MPCIYSFEWDLHEIPTVLQWVKGHSLTASPASRAAKVVTLAPARPNAAPAPAAAPAVVPWMVQLTLQGKRTGMRGSSEVPPASGDPSPWHQASTKHNRPAFQPHKVPVPSYCQAATTKKNSPNRRNLCPNIRYTICQNPLILSMSLFHSWPSGGQGSIFIRRARSTAAANSAFFRCSSNSASRFPQQLTMEGWLGRLRRGLFKAKHVICNKWRNVYKSANGKTWENNTSTIDLQIWDIRDGRLHACYAPSRVTLV